MSEQPGRQGMTSGQAYIAEWIIIGLCIGALVLVFQPFSRTLYGVGAGLVVLQSGATAPPSSSPP